MNLTIGSTFPNTWKRIKTQHLVDLCGAALALSAVVGVGAWQVSESGGGSAGGSTLSLPQRAAAPTQVYYIADSPQQAQALTAGEQMAGMAAFLGGQPITHTFEVIDVSTPAGQAGFDELQRSLMGAGFAYTSNVDIADLRGK